MDVLSFSDLIVSSLSSFCSFFIWQYWNNSFDLFTLLKINKFYLMTSGLSAVLSLWLLNTSRFSLLKTSVVFLNTISWFICSIHIPISFLQCSTLKDSKDYHGNQCFRELSLLSLSWINLSVWVYVLYLYTQRLVIIYYRNNTVLTKIIVLYCFFFTYVFLSSEIISDFLIYNRLLANSSKRYNVYELSDNFYILRRFNQIYFNQ